MKCLSYRMEHSSLSIICNPWMALEALILIFTDSLWSCSFGERWSWLRPRMESLASWEATTTWKKPTWSIAGPHRRGCRPAAWGNCSLGQAARTGGRTSSPSRIIILGRKRENERSIVVFRINMNSRVLIMKWSKTWKDASKVIPRSRSPTMLLGLVCESGIDMCLRVCSIFSEIPKYLEDYITILISGYISNTDVRFGYCINNKELKQKLWSRYI